VVGGCRQFWSLFRFGNDARSRTSAYEVHEMIARKATALLLVAIASTGAVNVQAQSYRGLDQRYLAPAPSTPAPFTPLFGYSSSPTSSSPIPREMVNFSGYYRPGTIVVNTSERRLYLVTGPGQALRYGIGVGRVGFTWAGTTSISQKREWPDWTPPGQMLRRRPDLPRHMAGGIENPLGARALYLGHSLFRIHGSNEPETIGQAVSSGCFRMTNEDVVDLYNRVPVGSKVVVLR
jgi:lipoprotein-anchoring transpeptidase ErfK/SrfK